MFPINPDDEFSYKDICTSIFKCTWSLTNYGLRMGGGVGDISLNVPHPHNNTFWMYKKTIFDFVFFVIINVLLLNMVFGIIIDAFTELRVEKETICII